MSEISNKYNNYFDDENEDNHTNNELSEPNLSHDMTTIPENGKKIYIKFKEDEENSLKEKGIENVNNKSLPLNISTNKANEICNDWKTPLPKNKGKNSNNNKPTVNTIKSEYDDFNNNKNNNSSPKIEILGKDDKSEYMEDKESNKTSDKILKNPVKTDNNQNVISEQDIEYYKNFEDLMEANEDEEMEYELMDLSELQKYIQGTGEEALDLNFKPISIDPQKEIENLENSHKEDPLNYENLYKLIYLYRDTKNYEKLKYFRTYTQMYFPLSDDMWKEWIKDELIDINKNNPDNFELRLQIIDLFEKALRDFYCKIKFFSLLFLL